RRPSYLCTHPRRAPPVEHRTPWRAGPAPTPHVHRSLPPREVGHTGRPGARNAPTGERKFYVAGVEEARPRAPGRRVAGAPGRQRAGAPTCRSPHAPRGRTYGQIWGAESTLWRPDVLPQREGEVGVCRDVEGGVSRVGVPHRPTP